MVFDFIVSLIGLIAVVIWLFYSIHLADELDRQTQRADIYYDKLLKIKECLFYDNIEDIEEIIENL